MSSDDYDLESGPDPAGIAAAAPEDPNPADPIHAVGIGPGDLDYLTPWGRRAIERADVVVGFETVVGFVADVTDADLLTCGYRDEARTLAAFAERVDADETGIRTLLSFLEHTGYVTERTGTYSLTTMTETWLLESAETSYARYFRFWQEVLYPFWREHAADAIREGEPSVSV